MLKPNYEAEQSVIGAIMMDSKKAMPLAALRLSHEDFFVEEYRSIFTVCEELFKSGKVIDAVTVISKLSPEYRKIVVEAANCTPSISNVNEYINAVRERSEKNTAIAAASNALINIKEETPIDECRQLSAEIPKSFNERSESKSVSAVQGFMDFCDRQEHPRNHISSGFSLLDKFVYMDAGDYVIIGGRPSAGKTAFTLQMMLHIAKNHKVGYFSLETKPAKIFERLIANYAFVSFGKIMTNSLNDSDWVNVTSSYDGFEKLNFDVIPAAGWTVDKVKSESIVKGYDVIFVDYLTLLHAKGKDRIEKAANISSDLHTLAQSENVMVVALSQLNREGKSSPDMTSLRESGQIEQDADSIMLLNYDPDTPEERELIIAKNKEGKVGKIQFMFDGDLQRFSLVETRQEETA